MIPLKVILNCRYCIMGKVMAIKFGGLPLKCISLMLTDYNLTDWLSRDTIIFM